MKKWLVLAGLLVLLLGVCTGARAEMTFNFDQAPGEWSRDGDVFSWTGKWAYVSTREGWMDNNSVFITADGAVKLSVRGTEVGKTYHVAAFVPRGDGTYGSVYGDSHPVEGALHSVGVLHDMLVLPSPGLYKGIVVMVVCDDGQVLEHTFDVLFDGGVYKASDEYRVAPSERFYTELGDGVLAMDEGYLFCWQDSKKTVPKEGLRILVDDRENTVYSGHGRMNKFYVQFAMHKNMDFSRGFSVMATLTEVATGKSFISTDVVSYDDIMYAISTGEDLYSNKKEREEAKHFWSVVVDLPTYWNEGEYELKVEVTGAGEDTVRVKLKKELDPAPYFAKCCPQLAELCIDFGQELSDRWNENGKVYFSKQGFFHLAVRNVECGEDYYALLQYTTPEGETFSQYRALIPSGRSAYENFQIASVAGTYKDIRLTVVGAGEVITHTFDMKVETSVDKNNPQGLVFGVDEWMKPLNFMGESWLGLEDYQTESGFFVPAPLPGVYQVTPADYYSLYFHLAFNDEPKGETLIIWLIRAEDAGKPPEECALFGKSWTLNTPYGDVEADAGWRGMDRVYRKREGIDVYKIPGNIPSGDYQWIVQLGDKTEVVDFTLEVIDEKTVLEAIEQASGKNEA